MNALFITGAEDQSNSASDVRSLFEEALPGSELIVVPGATHETVPYHFERTDPAGARVVKFKRAGAGNP